MNWKQLVDELGDEIAGRLEGMVEGAKEDLQTYGKEIAKNLVVAVRTQNTALQEELLEQAGLVAEMHRIRLNREANELLAIVVGVAKRVAKVALGV